MNKLHKKCKECDKEFFKRDTDSLKTWETRTKYCSKDCLNKSKAGKCPTFSFPKGNNPWNKGKTGSTPWNKGLKGFLKGRVISEITRQKLSLSQKGIPRPKTTGDKNGLWKGDNANQVSIHGWVKRQLGRPDTCEFCGKTGLSGHNIGWANIDHKYRRNIADWKRLCTSCHRKYDIENNGYKVKGR